MGRPFIELLCALSVIVIVRSISRRSAVLLRLSSGDTARYTSFNLTHLRAVQAQIEAAIEALG